MRNALSFLFSFKPTMLSTTLVTFISLASVISSATKIDASLKSSLQVDVFAISADKQEAATRCYTNGFGCDTIFDEKPISTKFVPLQTMPQSNADVNITTMNNMTERFSTKLMGSEFSGFDSGELWAVSVSMNTFKIPVNAKNKYRPQWLAVSTEIDGSLRVSSVLVDKTIHSPSCTTLGKQIFCGLDLNQIKPTEAFVPVTFQIINVPTQESKPSHLASPSSSFGLFSEDDLQILTLKHTGMLRIETMVEKSLTFSFNDSIIFQELPLHGDIFVEHSEAFVDRNIVYPPLTRFVYESLSNIDVVGDRTDVITYATLAPDSNNTLTRFNEYLQFNRVLASADVVSPNLTVPLNLYLASDNVLRSSIQDAINFYSTSVTGSLPDISGKFSKPSTNTSQTRNTTLFPMAYLEAAEDGFTITENGEFSFEATKALIIPDLHDRFLNDTSDEEFKKLLKELNVSSPIRVPLRFTQTLQDGSEIPGVVMVEYHVTRFDLQSSTLSPIPSLSRLDRLPPEFIRIIAWTCISILGAVIVVSLAIVIFRKKTDTVKRRRQDLERNEGGRDWKNNPIYQPARTH